LRRAWLGSVADGVLRHSAIPVLMLHPGEGSAKRGTTTPRFKRMLVPLDGSALATEILRPALDLAACFGAGIVLAQVVPPVPALTLDPLAPAGCPVQDDAATRVLMDDARDRLAGAARCLRERGVTDIGCRVVVSADPARGILDAAQVSGADIIALSTHGRGASRLLMGSVADKILTGSNLPLLVHHPLSAESTAGFLTAESVAAELPALSNG
jgi:nucleotide-binding universal stress UspA family protein